MSDHTCILHFSEVLPVSPAQAALFLHPRVHGRTPVFFDIETTGLSPKHSFSYLISSMVLLPDGAHFSQWFSPAPDLEPLLLDAFCTSLPPDACLIHYNGCNFDLPFLRTRIAACGLSHRLPENEDTLDFYVLFSPLQEWYQLAGRRQKHLELPAGFHRTDLYDGGELISFYQEYVGKCRFDAERADILLQAMLCHNKEDVLGLAALCCFLPLTELQTGRFSIQEQYLESEQLVLVLALSAPLPPFGPIFRPLLCEKKLPPAYQEFPLTLQGTGNTLRLQIPIISGKARYYFKNYKDYYYLPMEDTAIHKSIAACVDKQYRVPAKRDTAYQVKEGIFLPQTAPHFQPNFFLNRTDAISLFEVAQYASDPSTLKHYASDLVLRFFDLH